MYLAWLVSVCYLGTYLLSYLILTLSGSWVHVL